jgi:ribosomal protein L11 methyltransferase
MTALWTARILCKPSEIDALMLRWEELEPSPSAVSAVEKTASEWWVEAIYDHEPDLAQLEHRMGRSITLTGLKGENWVARSLEGLQPVRAGRFIVFGSHDANSIPPNLIRLQIEASLAFGTGHHGTTRGCLLAIDRWLKRQSHRAHTSPLRPDALRARATSPASGGGNSHAHTAPRFSSPACGGGAERVFASEAKGGSGRVPNSFSFLDVGTGTGVLALALAKATRRGVVATDIDPVAVAVTRANARANGAHNRVSAVTANGLSHRRVAQSGPYTLIVANILANPLMRLAPEIVTQANSGGTIILSGVLTTQARGVLGAYRARGCVLTERILLGEWTTLVLQKT